MNCLVPSGTEPFVPSGTNASCYRGPESALFRATSKPCARRNFSNSDSFGICLTDRAFRTAGDNDPRTREPRVVAAAQRQAFTGIGFTRDTAPRRTQSGACLRSRHHQYAAAHRQHARNVRSAISSRRRRAVTDSTPSSGYSLRTHDANSCNRAPGTTLACDTINAACAERLTIGVTADMRGRIVAIAFSRENIVADASRNLLAREFPHSAGGGR